LANGSSLDGRSRWLLTTRATPWVAKVGHVVIESTTQSRAKLDRLHTFEGKSVRTFSVARDFGFVIAFHGGGALRAIPKAPVIVTKSSLPYWELFMPNRSVLIVGPGRQWQVIPSDQPQTTAPLPATTSAQVAALERDRLASTTWRTVAELRDLIDDLFDEAQRLDRLLAKTRERKTHSRLRYLEAKWRRLRESL
jgi:hypothetical protein